MLYGCRMVLAAPVSLHLLGTGAWGAGWLGASAGAGGVLAVGISARGSAKLAEVEQLLGGVERELFADLDGRERDSLRRMLNAIRVTHGPTATRSTPR